jgi:GATA-binding protein
MKKSVIKRRKRVVPAAQGNQGAGQDAPSNSIESPESDRQSPPTDRGSMNPDGSINLGFRLRNEQQTRGLLPDPSPSMRPHNSQQMPHSDLTAYSSQSHGQYDHQESSLNDDNRLPPMTSYPSPTNRRLSLSPNSFLSPSRKRSFSSTDMEQRPTVVEPASTQPKRLSSIKSILNPGFTDSDQSDLDPSLRRERYPGGSPGLGGGSYTPSPANSGVGTATNSATDPASEGDRSKIERREMLQQEARRMREALEAKERELAEMGE